ncbi:MAG: penicillin-binding protein activator LpoB [Tannerellaceae bacterium]|jgi:hypothetical protein|nr:penicillin-binding protein activator LpoB [Tannerellaceae bacterium]
MKQLIVLILLLFTALTAKAQSKIAIFDPSGRFLSATTINTITGEISRIVVNNSRFRLLEREAMDVVLKEHKFQATYTDPNEAVKAGRTLGADYVCIIKVVDEREQYFIECRLVDVETNEVVIQGIGMAASRSVADIRLGVGEAAIGLASGETARAIRSEVSERKKQMAQNSGHRQRLDREQRKAELREALSSWYNHTSYGIGNGITYGKIAGVGLAGRYGGLFGFGFEAGAGVGLAHDHPYLSYSAGLRMYLYKALYISLNYGVIGLKNNFPAEEEVRFVVGGPNIIYGPSLLGGFHVRLTDEAVMTLSGGISFGEQGFKDIKNVKDIFQSHHLRPAWNIAFSRTIVLPDY